MLKRKEMLWILLSICLLVVLFTRAEAHELLPPVNYSADAAAESRAILTYQGVLNDKDGNPVETAVDMVFKLYDTDGDLYYTSGTHTVTPEEGQFTVYIGESPDPVLNPGALNYVTEIGVTVGDDDEMTPRQPLHTVLGSSETGVGVAGNSVSGMGVSGASQTYYGVSGFSESGNAVHGHSNSGIGASGFTSSTNPGIKGDNGSNGPGVFGWSARGTGVSGHTNSTDPNSAGVFGGNNGGLGYGVSGWSSGGAGVYGNSVDGYGVSGLSSDNAGVYGDSIDGYGIQGYSQNSVAIWGNSDGSIGVVGMSHTNDGVNGYTDSDLSARAGVKGLNGGTGPGVYGESTVGNIGVSGYTSSTIGHHAGVKGDNGGSGDGVYGYSARGVGVSGYSPNYIGVTGASDTDIGVKGWTRNTSTTSAGVVGENGGSGSGVYGFSQAGPGVYGDSIDGYGIQGYSQNSVAIWGDSDGSIGVVGMSHTDDGPGIYGESTVGNIGVSGYTSSTEPIRAGVFGNNGNAGAGVYGGSARGPGVYGWSNEGTGVSGYTNSTSPSSVGVFGGNNGGLGYGVIGWSSGGVGVFGDSTDGYGLSGFSSAGTSVYASTITGTAGYFDATNPATATSVFVNQGAGRVLYLENGGTDSDGSGGGAFIEAVNSDGGDVQFRVTTSGTVESDGGYDTPAADFAEMLPAGSDVEPGDVLVIGLDGKLHPSTEANQLTVVGVHSTRPGFVGGKGIDDAAEGQVPLAIMGVVPVKVSAENGAIQPGDLLVASSTPGHAMRASTSPANGTVIGKALGSLGGGTGVIQMLVMLQ